MQINRPKSEEKIIRNWKQRQIFKKSLDKKGGDFVFYEGPPTANAKPGVHHVEARVFKDIICRYKTMQGFRVLRKAGWDIHGLPVELAVEKALGLKNKKDIEKYGTAEFNQKCKESVWQHAQDWTNLTERIGFWLDLDEPYITGNPFYMETVFNIIKQFSDKGLLYQDYKVVPYCPRCGTGLSSHEVAQGYKKIREPAVYIKFQMSNAKCQINSKCQMPNVKTYLLAWTTTPWTLPGNVAIAVNPKITYILAKIGKEYLIVAKERKETLGKGFEIIKEFKGKELVGLSYQPLFDKNVVSLPRGTKNIYKVLAADFVTTEEGTGLVHVAPAFGQDDMELIKTKNKKQKTKNKKFPILLAVDEEGKFKEEVKKWAGVFVKDAEALITKHLEETGRLFKEEQYEHDYPFCWRCSTPLLYYAKKSWFIKTTAVKEKLIRNNKKINWVPGHIKQGRFGEWLNELKDWAVSRERYWGTPLPIWQCGGCGYQEVIGSREDLKKQKFSTNKYFVLRHGESFSNTKNINAGYPERARFSLTEKGIKQVEKMIEELKEKKINLIFASDVLRAKETAEIVAKSLGIKPKFDKRLRELNYGIFNNKPIQEGRDFYDVKRELSADERALLKFTKALPGGETYIQVRERILDFIKEVNQKYQNKNVLIISHECVITMLETASQGMTNKESAQFRVKSSIQHGELREINFNIFPYNQKGELDFHRPFIDEVKFLCPKCGKIIKRVPEVIDCWFDSGSMPFSQRHWPFAQEQKPKAKSQKHSPKSKTQKFNPPELFPADYISEAIDQTRGWFYTLLAISTLLGFESPYKNVIVLGHVLDEEGQKMSKSKGNVVDPWKMIEKYGADALRWYFYTINQPWDTKLFVEKDVEQRLKKFIMTLWNCYTFFETYTSKMSDVKSQISNQCQMSNVKNLLDKWVLSRLNGLIQEATEKLDKYDITGAGRAIEGFVINDLSLWYIRRSRKRFQKPANKQELNQASHTLASVLLDLVKLTAPFAPFISEDIYLGLVGQKIQSSVHLDKWPKPKKIFIDKELEKKMQLVRDVVALGLKIRNNEKIKVRQPLLKLKIQMPCPPSLRSGGGGQARLQRCSNCGQANVKPNLESKIENELLDLIKEELNIKEVEIAKKITKESDWVVEGDEHLKIALNTKITAELEEEGWLREIGRQIQIMRKNAGCKPKDKIIVYYTGDKELTRLLVRNKELLLSQIRAKDLIAHRKEKQAFNIEKQFQIGSHNLWLGLKIVVR